MSLEIIFEDRFIIAMNKPAGLLVHPVEAGLFPACKARLRTESQETCLSLLRKHCGRKVFPVHRLDRATSGALLFAKSSEAASMFCKQFESGEVQKKYVALVRGWLNGLVEVNHPVWNEIKTQRMDASTTLQCLEKFEIHEPVGKHTSVRYSLVAAHPHNGRYHQIRQHLKHLSHPIIGDTAHGDGLHNRFFRSKFLLNRMFLHAQSIEFKHPETGETQCINASVSVELDNVLAALRKTLTFQSSEMSNPNGAMPGLSYLKKA